MVIKTDQEGANAIQGLCDIALKSMGIQAMQSIQNILNKIEVTEEQTITKDLEMPLHQEG